MATVIDRLLYGVGLDVAGFTGDAAKIARQVNFLGKEAKTTFERDFGRSLAKSIDPKNFQNDLNKARQIIGNFGRDAQNTFQRTLGTQVSKGFFAVNTQAKGFFNTLIAGSSQLSRFHALLAGGIASGFALGLVIDFFARASIAVSKFAADFEFAIAKIRTIAEPGTNFDLIIDQLETLTSQLPQGLIDLSEGLNKIIGTGIKDTEQALILLEVSAKAATAGFTETNIAADALLATIFGFGKSVEDANFIANVLFQTVDDGAVEFRDLAKNMGDVSEPAKNAGASIQELGHIIATATLSKRPLDEIFTKIKRFLSEIATASPQQREFAESLGITLSKAGVDAAGGMDAFIVKLKEATAGSPELLAKLFPEQRALELAISLTGELSDEFVALAPNFVNITEQSQAMNKALNIALATQTNQWKILGNNISVITKNIGEGINRHFSPHLDVLNTVLGHFIQTASGGGGATGATNDLAQATEKAAKAEDDLANKKKKTVDEILAENKALEEQEKKRKQIREEAKKFVDQAKLQIELLNAPTELERRLIQIRQEADERRKMFKDQADAIKAVYELERAEIAKTLAVRVPKARGLLTSPKQLPVGVIPAPQVDLSGFKKLGKDIELASRSIVAPLEGLLIDLDDIGINIDSLAFEIGGNFGKLLSSISGFSRALSDPSKIDLVGAFSALQVGLPIIGDFLGDLFGIGKQSEAAKRAAELQRIEQERLTKLTEQLADQFRELTNAVQGFGAGQLLESVEDVKEQIRALTGLSIDLSADQIRQLINLQDERRLLLEEIQSLELEGLPVPQHLLDRLGEVNALLDQIGVSIGDLSDEERLRLTDLLEQLGLLNDAVDNFGIAASGLRGVLDRLNLEFELFNVDDPIERLNRLRRSILSQFGAIIPTTDQAIRDFISAGFAAIQAGGDALVNLLTSLNLEELTADQFAELLGLLNQFANDAQDAVDDITGAGEEIGISAVKAITFEQGNKISDELQTIRIIATQQYELLRRGDLMIKIAQLATAPLIAAHNNYFFMRDASLTQVDESSISVIDRLLVERANIAARAAGVN